MVSERMLANMFGTVVDTYHISRKAKFPKKRYMGMWSCLSHLTAQTIAPFPSSVSRYITRMSEKKKFCISLGPGKPRRTNSVTKCVVVFWDPKTVRDTEAIKE